MLGFTCRITATPFIINTPLCHPVLDHPKKLKKVRPSSAAAKKKKKRSTPLPTARNRQAIVRVHQIDALLRAGKRPNATWLAKRFRTSVSTIWRDIDFMRNRLNHEIACDPVRGGYYYTKEPPPLPDMHYSEGDLFGICMLEQMLTMFQGTQLGAQMRATFKKLSAGLHEKLAVSWDALAEVVSFRTTITPARVAPDILETLSQAVMAHEEVEFFYSGLQREHGELRRVEPYHLLVRDGIWYLSAYDPARGETRRFLPLRMQQVRATGNFFEKGERHTDPEEHLQHSIGVYGGDKPEQIRLRLTPRGVRLFSERIHHPSQQITPTEDGGHELTMTVYINPELERMLMSYCGEATVLEPESLRQQLLENARQMLAKAGEPV